MKMVDKQLKESISALFSSQKLAVLATNMKGVPYTSLVAFVASTDLKEIFFATLKGTTKYNNLLDNPNVSILIDTRKNKPSDFQDAVAISAEGITEVINNYKQKYIALYLEKHPSLSEFITSPNCAIIRVNITKYQYVSKFQNINILMLIP